MTAAMTMQQIIAAVGKGKDLARDLTREEAAEAMRLLMEAVATPYQIGAFLAAMRIKGETPEELSAFAETARRYGAPLRCESKETLVDLPLYSGKKRTFYAALPAAIVMAAAGVPVLIHGYSEMPGGKVGPSGILQAAGVKTHLEAEQAEEVLRRTGFGFAEISYLHLMLYRYLEIRKELGVRTMINTLLRVYNPAGAVNHLIGITHPPYLERLAKTLILSGSRRALIFRGTEGESELPLRSQTLTEMKDGEIHPLRLELEEVGLSAPSGQGIPLGTPEEEAGRIARILSLKEEGEGRDAVLLNAAAGIYVSGKATSFKEAIAQAREVLQSGKAAEKFFDVLQAVREV